MTEYDPHIADWISSLSALRLDSTGSSDFSRVPSLEDDTSIGFGDEARSTGGSLLSQESDARALVFPPATADENLEIDSEEDQLALDLATVAKQDADRAFDDEDYEEAESMLAEALSLIQELPLHRRRTQNLLNIHYKLAACAYYLHDSTTAESALVTVVEQSPSSTEDALNLCHAGHLLAMTCMKMNKLDPARSTCNNAYLTRRKLLGKDHEQCYQSLALLSLICSQQNQPSRAKIYLAMIPEEHRERLRSTSTSLVRTVSRSENSTPDDQVPTAQTQSPLREQTLGTEEPHDTDLAKALELSREEDRLRRRGFPPGYMASESRLRDVDTPDVSFSTAKSTHSSGVPATRFLRSVKNVTKGYSSVQVKVRNATSNDPCDPTDYVMSETAKITYNSSTDFYEVVDMLDKRLNDSGKNWRHTWKSLNVLECCLLQGSDLCITWSRKNIFFILKSLREFIHIDGSGHDVGSAIRKLATELISLIQDEERLYAERAKFRTRSMKR